MEFHQVRYFLAVCDTKNFTRAAQRCSVSQPALTTAIKKLEEELGASLFVRDRSNTRLTTLGRMVRPRLLRLHEESVSVAQIALDHKLLKDVPLRVGMLHSIGPRYIAERLENFCRDAPGVDIELRIGTHQALLEGLQNGDYDAVIGNSGDTPPPWMVIRPLYSERYLVALPPEHSLQGRAKIRLRELADEPYIDRLGCEVRQKLIEAIEASDVGLYAKYRTDQEPWIECLVKAGVGIAFIPEFCILSETTHAAELVEPKLQRTISLMRSADTPQTPALQLLWRLLCAAKTEVEAL
ncbi:MAG: LysR family transcriptional regulator [Myxococcota bacterium]